jgi:hypothetical protein
MCTRVSVRMRFVLVCVRVCVWCLFACLCVCVYVCVCVCVLGGDDCEEFVRICLCVETTIAPTYALTHTHIHTPA